MADDGLRWQVGVWDKMAEVYVREVDPRFAPVVAQLMRRARVGRGERVLDLGTGTGAVAWAAAATVGAAGRVIAVDISPEMLDVAGRNARRLGVTNVELREGRAEDIPAESASQDVVLASLSLMYAIDRDAAAREIARVLRPGGRIVAAAWAGPERCDIVRFQQIAGSFAPTPPVPGVGPGALADPKRLLDPLRAAGIDAYVETEETSFDFESFDEAWDVLAGVTTAGLEPTRRAQAKRAAKEAMWPQEGARRFRNATHFIVGSRA